MTDIPDTEPDDDPLYICEKCGRPLYEGDKACVGEIAFCEDHSPMLSEVIADWEADVGKPEDEAHWPEYFDTVECLEGWIAEQRADLAAHGDRKFVEAL